MNGVKDLVMTGMRFDDGNFAALSRERWMHLLVFLRSTTIPPVRQ